MRWTDEFLIKDYSTLGSSFVHKFLPIFLCSKLPSLSLREYVKPNNLLEFIRSQKLSTAKVQESKYDNVCPLPIHCSMVVIKNHCPIDRHDKKLGIFLEISAESVGIVRLIVSVPCHNPKESDFLTSYFHKYFIEPNDIMLAKKANFIMNFNWFSMDLNIWSTTNTSEILKWA